MNRDVIERVAITLWITVCLAIAAHVATEAIDEVRAEQAKLRAEVASVQSAADSFRDLRWEIRRWREDEFMRRAEARRLDAGVPDASYSNSGYAGPEAE